MFESWALLVLFMGFNKEFELLFGVSKEEKTLQNAFRFRYIEIQVARMGKSLDRSTAGLVFMTRFMTNKHIFCLHKLTEDVILLSLFPRASS